jgi:predicted TIM-barrel fold metal-dependent hydrolase
MVEAVIDTCIHHRWASDAELHPYLDENWQGYVGIPGSLVAGKGMRRLSPSFRFPNPAGDDLPSAFPPEGGPAGSKLDLLVSQVLDPAGVERALLLFDRGMYAAALPNPYLASAIVRGINDWNVDRWLSKHERLYGAVLLPGHIPADAAAEIRRLAPNPKIAAALFATNAIGQLAGHPIYHPIYEAAAETGLPVIFHRGLDALPDVPVAPAGGPPGSFAEYIAMAPSAQISQLVSLLTNGVFAKYPELRVYFVGAGVSWIPGVIRRLELMMRALRREIPWVTESPTEYFERQIRISTYGIERGAPEALDRLFTTHPFLETFLCHGSGYPSWDMTGPEEVAELFPESWRASVLHDNAAGWFRWGATAGADVGAPQESVPA